MFGFQYNSEIKEHVKITEINEFEIYVKNGAADVFGDNYLGDFVWECIS